MQQRRDGTVLTTREAIEAAQDYEKAAALTAWVMFDQGETWHWPLCNRKLGLAAKVREIKRDIIAVFLRSHEQQIAQRNSAQNSWMRVQPSRRLAMSVA